MATNDEDDVVSGQLVLTGVLSRGVHGRVRVQQCHAHEALSAVGVQVGLAPLVGPGVVQRVLLSVQQEPPQSFVEPGSSLSSEILEAGVQLVHLPDPDVDSLAVRVLPGVQPAGGLAKLPHRGGKVVNRRLLGLVFPHHVLGAELVPATVLHHHVQLQPAHPGLGRLGVTGELLYSLLEQQLLLPLLHQLLQSGPPLNEVG